MKKINTLFQENKQLKDFIMVNCICVGMSLLMLIIMVLSKIHVIPSTPCMALEVLHIYCPGCGGTRALFAFFKGKFLKSLYYNPAIVLGALLIAYYEIMGILYVAKIKKKKLSTYPVYVFLAIVALYAAIRDLLLCCAGIDMLGNVIH